MARYNSSRTVPAALVLVIVAVVIAALVSLARAVFFSGQSTTTPSPVATSQTALLSTSADRSVRMTVRGPIVANEDFKTYQIDVSPNSRSLTFYAGYLNNQTSQVALDNTIPAYKEFVYALNRANLAKGNELSGDANNTSGICATGKLYQFEILKANTSVKTLWTSTCSGSVGSLDASLTQLTNLFTSQITTAQRLISQSGL